MTDRIHVDGIRLLNKIMASLGTSSIVVEVPSGNFNNHSVITKIKQNNFGR